MVYRNQFQLFLSLSFVEGTVKLRILLADDHELMRRGLCALLQ
jgi:hypothetical protein